MTPPKDIRNRKPTRCPKCGQAPVATIFWGFPAFTPQLEKDLELGKVVLGGYCLSEDDPAWQCSSCDYQIWRAIKGVPTQKALDRDE